MSKKPLSFYSKFKRNTGALIGSFIILLACIVAVFAYALAPDDSPYANRMILELATVSPGHEQSVIEIKPIHENAVSVWDHWVSGKPNAVRYIPISSFTEIGDTIYAQKTIDIGISEPIVISKTISGQTAKIKKIKFLLGSDRFGRDIWSRLLLGTRVSLGVGSVAVLISVLIGFLLGAFAGYYRGRIDAVVSWLIQVVWSLPSVLLVFAITMALGKGLWVVYVAVGLTLWVNVARLVRGQVLSIREMSYVEAARAMGLSSLTILFRHILPNLAGPLIVVAAGNFASAILLEAGLSFLGIGVQAPQPSWGLMIKEHYNFLITQKPLLAIIPGIAIMLLVLAFNLVGNGLRDAFDVKGG